jgi:inosine/xanthosine triphosphatase
MGRMSAIQPESKALATLATATNVVVGSTNPVKIAAVTAVLERSGSRARVSGLAVPSGVRDQPEGDAETIRGATQRAKAALEVSDADFAIGIEGGVVEEAGSMRTCAWAAVVTRDGRVGVGGSLAMTLPDRVAALVRGGMELGHAMDRVSGGRDTKHGAGAVGILTAGLVNRQRAYEALVTYALAQFLAPAYFDGEIP